MNLNLIIFSLSWYIIIFLQLIQTAIIKMWLNNNCKETPEEMVQILISEYNIKTKA